jgi:hypothetical protein
MKVLLYFSAILLLTIVVLVLLTIRDYPTNGAISHVRTALSNDNNTNFQDHDAAKDESSDLLLANCKRGVCGKFGHCPLQLHKTLRDPTVNRAVYHFGGDRKLHAEVFQLIQKQKETGEATNILFTGSSITAMGYFTKFVDYLQNEEQRNITVNNLGRGASDTIYHLYCVEYDGQTPDIIFAEMRFTDWGADSQSKEALFRKLLNLRRRDGGLPLLVLVHTTRLDDQCDVPDEPRFNDFAGHYGLSIIDTCLVTRRCFGANNYALWPMYSQDTIHPTTDLSRIFLAEILKEWWKHAPVLYEKTASSLGLNVSSKSTIPKHLYPVNAVNDNTHCRTLNDPSNMLEPVRVKGFEMKTRIKIGALGFSNVKRCWQGNAVGDSITFPFTGSRLQVSIYQNSGPLGVMSVFLDDEKIPRTNISSFFEGYSWAKGNGRQFIISLFDNLSPGSHTVTFTITDEPANPSDPGHDCQIIALLYSD